MKIPEFGARHPFVYDDELDDFFGYIHSALWLQIPYREPECLPSNHKRMFRVYDDPKRAGLTVLERRVTRAQSQRGRFRWSHQDAARIREEIQDTLGREGLTNPTDEPTEITFTNVIRVGDADSGPKARKLGLILDQTSTEAEMLVREHEIIVDGIRGMLKNFREPYSTYVPHFTVARIHREAGNMSMDKAVEAVQALLPHTLKIEPLDFYTEDHV